MLKRREGFTLVELLMVIFILAIISALAVPRFLTTKKEAQMAGCQSNIATIDSTWELQHIEHPDFRVGADPDGYAPLADLFKTNVDFDEDGTNDIYFPKGKPVCPFSTDGGVASWPYVDTTPADFRVDAHAH